MHKLLIRVDFLLERKTLGLYLQVVVDNFVLM